jgi:hypothetical protein
MLFDLLRLRINVIDNLSAYFSIDKHTILLMICFVLAESENVSDGKYVHMSFGSFFLYNNIKQILNHLTKKVSQTEL